MKIRIISLNCRSGINKKRKLEKLKHYLKEEDWQIAFLQETSKINERTQSILSTSLDVKILHYPHTDTKPGTGTAILVHSSLVDNILECNHLNGGRLIDLKITLNNEPFNLINAYINTRPAEKKKDLIILDKLIKGITNNIIIGGDFNCITEPTQRTGHTDQCKIDKEFVNLINTNYLIDTSNLFSKQGPTYIGQKSCSLLDRFLVSEKNICKSLSHKICPFSDHIMIILQLFSSETPKTSNKGYWKLNTELLNHTCIVDNIKHIWQEWRLIKNSFSRIQDWWDKGKEKIKKYLIKEGIQRAKSRNKEETEFYQLLTNELKSQNPNFPLINDLKQRLHEILTYKIEGVKVRSREILLPAEEKGSKNFYNIEIKNVIKEYIGSIKVAGREIVKGEDIKKEIELLYRSI